MLNVVLRPLCMCTKDIFYCVKTEGKLTFGRLFINLFRQSGTDNAQQGHKQNNDTLASAHVSSSLFVFS